MQAALSVDPGRGVGVRGTQRPRAHAGPPGRRTAGCPSCRSSPMRCTATSTCTCCRSTRRRSAPPTTASPTRPCGSCCTSCSTCPSSRPSTRPGAGSGPAYVRYNQAFAEAIADDAAENAAVMVQDYHLFLVPRMLRELRPDVRIGFFTHTPWVPTDYFTTLPDDVAYAVVDGMLGADVVGFHTQRWADLFCETAAAVCDAEGHGRRGVPARHRRRARCSALGGRRDVDNALRVLRRRGRRPAGDRPGRPHRTVEERLARAARLPRVAAPAARSGAGGSSTPSTTTRPARTCRPTASTPPRSSGWPPRSTTSSAPTTGRRSCSRSRRTTRRRWRRCGAAT